MFAHTTAHSCIRDSLPLCKNEKLLHVAKAKASPRDLQTCVMIWEKKHFVWRRIKPFEQDKQSGWMIQPQRWPKAAHSKCKRRSPVGRCVRQCAPLKTLSASMSFSCIPCLALRFKLPPSAILISQQMHHLKWWQGIFWICGHTRHPSCHCRLGCRVSTCYNMLLQWTSKEQSILKNRETGRHQNKRSPLTTFTTVETPSLTLWHIGETCVSTSRLCPLTISDPNSGCLSSSLYEIAELRAIAETYSPPSLPFLLP